MIVCTYVRVTNLVSRRKLVHVPANASPLSRGENSLSLLGLRAYRRYRVVCGRDGPVDRIVVVRRADETGFEL